MRVTDVLSIFLEATFNEQKETDEINLNHVFYLTQYVQNIIHFDM